MTRITLLFLTLLLLVATTGCRPKKPVTTVDAPTAAPAPVTSAPSETPAPAPAADPLAGSLDEVNAYVRSAGLLGDVYFDFDQASLRDEARRRLESNADFLRKHPQFQVTIEGHCDERGTNDYNLALSERRAAAARSYLTQSGVAATSLRVVAYGEEKPVCSSSNEACWQQNRRAHFVITDRKN